MNKKYLYETHMHTFESSFCSRAKAKEHVRAYKDRGYSGIIITDHFRTENFQWCRFKNFAPMLTWEDKVNFFMRGYEIAKEEGDKIGLDVFLGWEFYDNGAEFLTYGLDKEFLLKHKDIDKMPKEEYSKLVRENGGFLAQAHPYRKTKSNETPVNPELVDAVEIYNDSRRYISRMNAKAIVFAREHNIPVQAGSDAHKINLKSYSGVMLDKKAESIFDIINAIKNGEAQPILPPKESELWLDDLEKARKFAQSEVVSEQLVKVLYDCKHAKEIAEELCEYIQEHTEFDAICSHCDDAGKIQKSGKNNKTIIIGHHSDTKKKLKNMKSVLYQQYGTKYSIENDLCVLTASKSKLKDDKIKYNQFKEEFANRFYEDPDNMYLRKAQFNYIVTEFMQNSLYDFLKMD